MLKANDSQFSAGRNLMPNKRKRLVVPPTAVPSNGDSAVMVCIALVVAAIVVGLHVQLGLSLGLAAVAGMSLFIGLVGFQAWRRGEAERAALADELFRLESELEMTGGAGPLATAHVEIAGSRHATQPVARTTGPSTADPYSAHPVRPSLESVPPHIAHDIHEPAGPQFEAYHGAPSVLPGESFQDYGSPPAMGSGVPTQAADFAEPAVPPAAASAVREDDVELLQRRIKDMLYQVTAAEQARDLAAVLPAAEPDVEIVPSADAALAASIDALQSAAHSMRQRPGPDRELHIPQPEPEVPADAALISVRDAIAAGRVDVFLEPILGLGDQATQHYEVSVKLRGASGQDLGAGDGDVLAGRGLLPLFDSVRIGRSAIVAERLQSRGKSGSVFSRASGEALIEPEFTRNMQLDFVARPATARQLILTFSQADIRSFRVAEQRAVSALSALGFRFAISALTDLDMNFAAMAQAGFQFVKIDAAVMTDGLPHPGGFIPASDVCRFLADQGFGLIVEGIDSEETLARVFGFGVLMGQGTLFGGRRPVKTDVVAKSGQAAA
ncbi:MAG: hypothetical protein C0519_05080 [Hyphomicrobium sp.]|nr:hypothetical protein [Hyphomicrobium sp.]PPD08577.1 MAG: hypothetical protein CTY28_04120 [Hyphomicrobium sp.]